MKKTFVLATLLAFCSLNLDAQETPVSYAPQVVETSKLMVTGANTCLTAMIPETNKKVVERLWKDLMKTYDGKPEKVKKSKEQLSPAVRIAAISGTGTINVYHLVEESGDDVELTVWFDMGDGKYLNTKDYPSSYKDAEALIKKFGVDVKKEMVRLELEEEEKALKNLEKEFEKLIRDKEGLEKDIENYKKRITEAEHKIHQNLKDQEDTKHKIQDQKAAVGEVVKRLGEIQ